MRAIVCNALTASTACAQGAARSRRARTGRGADRIAAAGLNYADLLVTPGKYQVKHAPPFVPGFEPAGTIEAVGPTSRRSSPAIGSSRFRSRRLCRGRARAGHRVYAAPTGLDAAEAAGFPIAYGTSYLALVEQAKLQAGETLLVHGAAGGVGLTAVEIGKALGARVIATAGGPDKCAIAQNTALTTSSTTRLRTSAPA